MVLSLDAEKKYLTQFNIHALEEVFLDLMK